MAPPLVSSRSRLSGLLFFPILVALPEIVLVVAVEFVLGLVPGVAGLVLRLAPLLLELTLGLLRLALDPILVHVSSS
jgi:hypothetical protein